jgi:hypothetical protein
MTVPQPAGAAGALQAQMTDVLGVEAPSGSGRASGSALLVPVAVRVDRDDTDEPSREVSGSAEAAAYQNCLSVTDASSLTAPLPTELSVASRRWGHSKRCSVCMPYACPGGCSRDVSSVHRARLRGQARGPAPGGGHAVARKLPAVSCRVLHAGA